jgi:predicted lipoprotein with Yx(FWY)xxD motif
MASRRTAGLRAAGAATLASLALFLAACGSSSSSSSTSNSASPAAATSAPSSTSTSSSAAAASGLTVGTANAHGHTYLTGSGGRAIYLWAADSHGKSSCSGSCAQAWPPVTTKGKPAAGSGVTASELSTITRSDGSEQVTYNGHPLYYFAGDTSAGSTSGEGSSGFGAKWWLVAPSGSPVTGGGSSSGGSSSTSSSGGWG